ncbi:MAG: 3-hydroxyanthranilate 3,4-dioxygenase [Myxococcales bacterium]|nr:3-hydroxyanthranilate 3,4-dioxygenase [Myxococcales bacterium]
MSTLNPLNFKQWIDENRHLLKPPIGNAVVYNDAEFMIMVVGGPNSRSDYHIDPAEEFFYQIEGDMVLKVVENGEFRDIRIREGDIFLLPAHVPHSPQRFSNTVGLVIERKRRDHEKDGLRWYCHECGQTLYEETFQLEDITKDLIPVIERYRSDDDNQKCDQCGHVSPKK